jgi:positive regulator of sigma E activity
VANARLSIILISPFFSENILAEDKALESRSWLFATIIMVLLALVMFIVQHFLVQLFDFAVEVSVFYIPAFALVVFILWRHFKSLH